MKSTVVAAAFLLAASGSVCAQMPADSAGENQSVRPMQERGTGMQGEGQHPYMRGGMRGHHHGMHGQGMQHSGGGMMHGLRFPPGYEKLEMQMHAEMMESMARILKKYADQLPDKPQDR